MKQRIAENLQTHAEEDAGNYVQVLPEAYAETDLKALWKNIAQKSEGRVKKRRFFHAPFVVASLFSAVFAWG